MKLKVALFCGVFLLYPNVFKAQFQIAIIGNGMTKAEAEQQTSVTLLTLIRNAFAGNNAIIDLKNDDLLGVRKVQKHSLDLAFEQYAIINKVTIDIDSLVLGLINKGLISASENTELNLSVREIFLKEQAQLIATNQFVSIMKKQFESVFIFNLEQDTPYSKDLNSTEWYIPLKIGVQVLDEIKSAETFCFKALSSISMDRLEFSYQDVSDNMVFPIRMIYLGEEYFFYFQKIEYVEKIVALNIDWEGFSKSYLIITNLFEKYSPGSGQSYSLIKNDWARIKQSNPKLNEISRHVPTVRFPKDNCDICVYDWTDVRSISEISNLGKYSIESASLQNEINPTSANATNRNIKGNPNPLYKLNEDSNGLNGPGYDPTKIQGNPNGLITGKGVLGGAGGNGGAGSGGSGYEYSFFREMKAKPALDETVTVEGSILVNVIVDKSGKVIDASVDVANSKYNGGSSKAELNRLASKAAKSAKFAADPAGGGNKSGNITIHFKIK
jgi:TonB family protein